MKKPLLKQIRAVAAKLPAMFTDGKMTVKGSEIIRLRGDKDKDKDGKAIDPDKWYTLPTQVGVNHARRIKRIFQRQGHQHAQAYIDQVIQAFREGAEAHTAVMEGMPKQQMSL